MAVSTPDFVMEALAAQGVAHHSLLARVTQLEAEHRLHKTELERLGRELQKAEFERQAAEAKKKARKPKTKPVAAPELPAPLPPGGHRALFEQAARSALQQLERNSTDSVATLLPRPVPTDPPRPLPWLPVQAPPNMGAAAVMPPSPQEQMHARLARLEAELARRNANS